MANTLTSLVPTIVRAADMVARELTGLIPAVTLNATAEQVAKDQSIVFPVSNAQTAADIAASATGPDPSDRTVGNDSMSISKSRSVTFYFTGEEQKGLAGMYDPILKSEFAQAMRTLANEIETDLAALYNNASRAYGSAGNTPFGTANDFTDASYVRKVLADNGAPLSDLQLVVDTAAGANLRGKQAIYTTQGDQTLLRQGIILDINGFKIRESAQIKYHTKGTGSSYNLNLVAGYAVGSTTFTLEGGSGTILAGDIFTNSQSGRDSLKYVVKTALSGSDVVLQKPGNRTAWVNDDTVAVGNSYRANMAFARSAIHLLLRVPAMPAGGDSADDVITVTDPYSGISFQIAMYRQRRRIAYEVGLAWGVKCVKPEYLALLLG
jgi:hypothetical protein